jgi:hypothetical protein
MTQEGVAIAQLDILAQVRSEPPGSLSLTSIHALHALQCCHELQTKYLETRIICLRTRTHDNVNRHLGKYRKNFAAYDLPQSPLQPITIHNRMAIFRDYYSDPRMMQKGSEEPNLEVIGSSSLPFT